MKNIKECFYITLMIYNHNQILSMSFNIFDLVKILNVNEIKQQFFQGILKYGKKVSSIVTDSTFIS